MPQTITWQAYEHQHADKGVDWFWALGIVAVSGAIVALLFGNVLFALLIVVAAFTLGLLASRSPQLVTYTLTERGILADATLYPYQMLEAFWVRTETERERSPVLIVDAQQFLSPHLVIPLADTDPEAIREYLARFLPEEEMEEPLAQRIGEFFGV